MSRELTRLSVMAGVTPGGRAVCLPPVAPPPPPQGLLAREPSCRCHSPCRRQLITATTKLPTCCHAIHKTAMRRPLPPPSHSHDFYLSSSQLCLGPSAISKRYILCLLTEHIRVASPVNCGAATPQHISSAYTTETPLRATTRKFLTTASLRQSTTKHAKQRNSISTASLASVPSPEQRHFPARPKVSFHRTCHSPPPARATTTTTRSPPLPQASPP